MKAKDYLLENGYKDGMIWTLDNVAKVCEEFSNRLEQQVKPKIADKLEKLQQHIKICPIGWFDNKMKVFRTTTEEEVLIWLKKLHDISNFSE